MTTITIDDAELRELVSEHAQCAAAEYLTNRIIPKFPAYFFESDWIVTYDWLADQRQQLMGEIYLLQHRLAKLEKPWWRRWLHR